MFYAFNYRWRDKTLEDIQKILNLGADKISINSKALEDMDFISKAANRFGSQCIVCSIDVKRKGGQFCVYDRGKIYSKKSPLELALEYEKKELKLLLTSVDLKEGQRVMI